MQLMLPYAHVDVDGYTIHPGQISLHERIILVFSYFNVVEKKYSSY